MDQLQLPFIMQQHHQLVTLEMHQEKTILVCFINHTQNRLEDAIQLGWSSTLQSCCWAALHCLDRAPLSIQQIGCLLNPCTIFQQTIGTCDERRKSDSAESEMSDEWYLAADTHAEQLGCSRLPLDDHAWLSRRQKPSSLHCSLGQWWPAQDHYPCSFNVSFAVNIGVIGPCCGLLTDWKTHQGL